MPCPKCSGLMIEEPCYTLEGSFCIKVIERRCLYCGEREWPQDLKDQRAIARAIYSVNEKTRRKTTTY